MRRGRGGGRHLRSVATEHLANPGPVRGGGGAAVGGGCAQEPPDALSTGEDLGCPERSVESPPSGLRLGAPLDSSLGLEAC